MAESPQTCFEKAAEIIRRMQQAKWNAAGGALIDISDLAATREEAAFVSKVANQILLQLYGFGVESLGATTSAPSFGESFKGSIKASIEKSGLKVFCDDHSLDLPSTPIRHPSFDYKPENLQKALEILRWKESLKWVPRDDNSGYVSSLPVSHGFSPCIFFGDRDVRDANAVLRGAINHFGEMPEVWDPELAYPATDNPPQIWSNNGAQLWVTPADAQAVLLDFLGLDDKILKINPSPARGA